MNKQIYIEVYDPTKGTMEDDAWVEVTFNVPLSFTPDEPSVGYRGGWQVDGPITDDDGYEFTEDDLDVMSIFFDSESTGFDWDTLFAQADEELADMIAERQIEAYESHMDAYQY